jgi:hypothetical protein
MMGDYVIIDCDTCVMRRSAACRDCFVTFLCDQAGVAAAGPAADEGADAVVLDLAEARAVRWFAAAGMVPTLRHRAAGAG